MSELDSIEGGCACGRLRYACAEAAVVQLNCHCRKCQYMSGGGHSSVAVFRKESTQITGVASCWSYIADSGGRVFRHFCPHCGTSVYSLLELHPLGIAVNAGTLDSPKNFSPSHALFASQRLRWDPIPEGLEVLSAGLHEA